MLYAMGRRDLVHPSLGRVHRSYGTPVVAIGLMAALTAAAAMFGDAILVPITEVGSLAVGVGWLSACAAYLLRRTAAKGGEYGDESGNDGVGRRRGQQGDRADEGGAGRAGQLHECRMDCGLARGAVAGSAFWLLRPSA